MGSRSPLRLASHCRSIGCWNAAARPHIDVGNSHAALLASFLSRAGVWLVKFRDVPRHGVS